jgi:glucose uptake protein GlcU
VLVIEDLINANSNIVKLHSYTPLRVLVCQSFWSHFLLSAFAGLVYATAVLFFVISATKVEYAVSVPLSQCSVVVNGMWGIFVFSELKGRESIMFFVAAIVVIGGAVLLAQATSVPE